MTATNEKTGAGGVKATSTIMGVLMAARATLAAPPGAPFLRDFIYPILQREAAAISATVGRQP